MLGNKEETVLVNACDALAHQAGLRLERAYGEEKNYQFMVDAVVYAVDYPTLGFGLIVKKWAQHANVGAIASQMKDMPLPGVLVADYINPKLAERLREAHIQFIDTVGNAYIDAKPVYIYVKGNKQGRRDTTTTGMQQQHHRAFTVTGLKVLYAFLCNPELVRAPYRDIAEIADVAHGTVGWVVMDLKQLGYLIDRKNNKDRKLVRCKELFEKWIHTYPLTLRPKQRVGRFTTIKNDWPRNLDIGQYNACWGGETAAKHYTKYLRPEITTIYIPKNDNHLLTDLRLHRDEHGKVEVMKKFWGEKEDIQANLDYRDANYTPPLLTYADLLATGDARNLEAARLIYDEYLVRHIEQD